MTFPLTIIFMFLVFWRPQEWLWPWMFGWPVLQVIVYAAALSLAAEASQEQVRLSKSPAFMLAIGLWFSTIMSHVAHGYFQGVIDTIQESFKPCLFCILMLAVVDRLGRARAVVLMFVLGAVMMSVDALLQQQYGVGFSGVSPLWVINEKTGQWQPRSQFVGVFGDPNDLGQMLAGSIPLVFAYPRRLGPFSFMASMAVAGLIYAGLLSTHSRGGIVAISAAATVVIILRFPQRWVPKLVAFALVGALVLCLIQGPSLLDASAMERVDYWGQANQVFKHQPIFGIGYGMFGDVTGDRAAHNAFVSCYTELGLFGYWFWFGLLQLGLVGCWRTLNALRRLRTPSQAYLRRLTVMSMASLTSFAAGGYFLSRSFIMAFFFLFGLLNAIPLLARQLLPEEHPLLLDTRRDVIIMGTISMLFSVVYIYVSILVLNRGR